MAIEKPSPTSPTRFASGTDTPSKMSSAVGEPRMPILCSSRAVVNPAVPCSTTKQLRCLRRRAASGSVTAKTFTTLATLPWLMKRLAPSIRQPSPSRRRGRAHGPGVGARFRLGQRQCRQRPSRGQFGEPARLLLGGAGQRERQRPECLQRDDEPARGAGPADLFDGQADREQLASEAAVLDRERQGQDVMLSEELDHVPREFAGRVDGCRPRRDALVGQDAHGVAEVALFHAQTPGHRAAQRITPPS